MHEIINTPGITASNAKATIDASFIVKDHGYTTTIWAKDGITRVYINKARKAMGYVEFRGNRVAGTCLDLALLLVVVASSDTGTSLRNILEVLSGGR